MFVLCVPNNIVALKWLAKGGAATLLQPDFKVEVRRNKK